MNKFSEIAIIDIGSNSVRLVVYDGLKHNPTNLFNEKVLCGLAEGMDKTGCLNKLGVDQAFKAIGRYMKIADLLCSSKPFAFATSAVRDAKDGGWFVAEIKQKFGIEINVLTGEEEAHFAAQGVISSIIDADGVVGDLGGGSLELIAVPHPSKDSLVSYPIGPLRILDNKLNKFDYTSIIDSHLKNYQFGQTLYGKNFYAVGGGFRNLAKIHIDRVKYPLQVIQNYEVPVEEIDKTLQVVSRMTHKALAKLTGISNKRLMLLPYTALILERLIALGKPKNIVFSVNGVREGIIYSKISQSERKKDPLISGCIELASRSHISSQYGKELFAWVKPILAGFNYNSRLVEAACYLSDIARYENPSYRAEIAYRKVLDSSLTGINHCERVFIAKALYYRYRGTLTEQMLVTIEKILTFEEKHLARTLGFCLRLARSISANKEGVLGKCPISFKDGEINIKFAKQYKLLMGEAVEKRLELLKAELLIA